MKIVNKKWIYDNLNSSINTNSNVSITVKKIIGDIKKNKDKALLKYVRKFENKKANLKNIIIPKESSIKVDGANLTISGPKGTKKLTINDKIEKHIKDHHQEVVKYFEKKHKAKIEIGINNNLNLEDYIIEFKSKTKKVLDKIEKVEKLEAIKIDNKKEDNNIQSKNRKIFKKRKFRKKFYKKKTK